MATVTLTDRLIRQAELKPTAYVLWDQVQIGLCVRIQPTGTKTFKCWYRVGGRLRWYSIDRFGAVGLAEARQIARTIRARAALNQDPQADKLAQRSGDTLDNVYKQYLENKLKVGGRTKSWQQPDKLMRRYILPTLGARKVKDITRQDLWRIFDKLGNRKSLANQVMASASSVFNWAVRREIIRDNPCRAIDRHKTQASTRYLTNDEIRTVWPLFEDLGLYQSLVLKLVLLTGQRPGEVRHMRWEHIVTQRDGSKWWNMPGEAIEGIWPGTKNGKDHQILLTAPVVELLQELELHTKGFVFEFEQGSQRMHPDRADHLDLDEARHAEVPCS